MKKRRLLSVFLLLGLALTMLAPQRAAALDEIEIDARAALLVEANTGEILYAKNIHQENYPASITKVMVALLVFEAIDEGRLTMDTPVTASETAAAALPAGATTANIQPGEVLTVEQLLYCLLIPSANEAGNILAEAVSGSIEAFVARMNGRARELGCENTHFVNPHGLHDDDHYTTAWDIYLITAEALKHDRFLEICNSKSYELPPTNLSAKRTFHSTNYLISNWYALGYLYNGAQGIKTGTTPEAGRCLVSSAVRGSRRLISVVLGAERVQQPNGKYLVKCFSETARLFDYGFDNFTSKTILTASEPIREVPVTLSGEANYVVVHPAETLKRMLPNDLAPEDLTRTVTLHSESVEAPVAAGDELGTITLSHGDTVYGTVPLLALTDVSASWVLVAQRDALAFLAQKWVKLAGLGLVLLILLIAVLRIALSNRRRRYGRRRRQDYSRTGYRGRRRR